MTNLALGPSWLDPDFLIQTFGPVGILAIVFAESGLLIGFFLPGDSLLFTTGLLIVTDQLHMPLWLMCLLIVLAAVLGDQVGYMFGKKVGPTLFKRPDSRFFKQENVEKAHEFFEKHGPKSLVLARFVPIVRTFTPIIAGVSGMRYRSFVIFNIVGGTLWGAGVTLLGAGLGQIDLVHQHIEKILVGIVLLSVVPIVVEYLRSRRKSDSPAEDAAAEAPVHAGNHPPAPGAPGTPGTPAAAPYGAPGYGAPGYGAPGRHPGAPNAYGPNAGHGQGQGQQDHGQGYGQQGYGPGGHGPGHGQGPEGPMPPGSPYGVGRPLPPEVPYGGTGGAPQGAPQGPPQGAPYGTGAAPQGHQAPGHHQAPQGHQAHPAAAPQGPQDGPYAGPYDYDEGGAPQGPPAAPQDPSAPQNRSGRGRHARR
ncbi:VTT domain-containing protein [Streptomyces smyrnaeus]|uniref:VTT domain-containing protein n=1 Tax=Streptomyces smyrnaeus TaxID=1387713 RepID=A0ABS3Y3I1_9ACTN|nr:DedA family protein [Streptomyces smyrnaeus]MBO8202203.1 VTT domain-containing protein [Streptomyces smyrnaeus]